MVQLHTILLVMAAGLIGGALGALAVMDYVEVRRHILAMAGDTREDTMRNIRAQIELMRREYALKPVDRFSIEMQDLCDKLEQTMNRLEAEQSPVLSRQSPGGGL